MLALDKTEMDPMISSIDSNEYFNSISHLIGAILAVIGMVVLIVEASLMGNTLMVVCFAIYGTTLFFSFLASCLLHFNLIFGNYYRPLGILDHDAIYLLIAGTYTPISLCVIGGATGWGLFALIWGLAVFNIVIKSVFFQQLNSWMSTIGFVVMGWPVAFYIPSLYSKLGGSALVLIFSAGILFTIGAVIFERGRPNPAPPYFGNHEIWHIFVLLGNSLFFAVMYIFVLPLGR